MQRRATAVVGVGAAAALLLVGCGSETAGTTPLSGTPRQQVQTAFHNLITGDTLTGKLHLGADSQSLLTFASRTGGGMQAKQAAALSGAAVSFTVHSTSGALDALTTGVTGQKNSQMDLTFTDQGRRYAELRSLDQSAYLQADVKGLIALVGQPASAYQQALTAAGNVPYGKAFVSGQWLEVKGSQAKQLLKRLQGASGKAMPSPNATQRKQFLANLERLFSKDVTVRKIGTTGGATTYALTANTREVVSSFLSSVTTLEPMLSGQMNRFNSSQVPSRNITFRAVVTGSKLTRLSFDFAQLVKGKSVPNLPLQLDFSTASQSVTAPSGATVVDLDKFFRAFAGAARGGLSYGSGSYSSAMPVPPAA